MLRALCECLHIRGAKNSVVFENSHSLKMICISFIINKKLEYIYPLGAGVNYEILYEIIYPHLLVFHEREIQKP